MRISIPEACRVIGNAILTFVLSSGFPRDARSSPESYPSPLPIATEICLIKIQVQLALKL